MSAVAFDTLKLARKLEAAGFDHKQAADTAEALSESLSELSDLATKHDLTETKVEILKWLIGLIGFQTLAVLGGVAALFKLIH